MYSLKWVVKWLGKKRRILITAIVTGICSITLMGVEPFIFRRIIDNVLLGGDYDALPALLARAMGIACAFLVLRYITNLLYETASQHVVINLRRTLFDKILHQTVAYYREHTAGDLIILCTGDTDMVRHYVCWVIPKAFECSAMLIGVLIVFLSISPLYALCLFILTPVSALLAFRLGRAIRPAHARIREQRAKLSTVVNENINGNRVIKAFAREQFEIDKFEIENKEFRDANIDANRIWLRHQPLMDYMAHALGIINLIVGALMVINGKVTLGQMNIFFALAWALNEPMLTLGTIINDSQRFATSAEKLMALQFGRIAVESPLNAAEMNEPRGHVVMKEVSLYAGNTLLLENINFEAQPGRTIGVMGPTGSGKTVLASLIPRLVDVSGGGVFVDGVNVKEYNLRELRRRIGMTTQDVFLFSDSVENNVAYGGPDAPMEAVERAADAADAAEFVRKLPQGYNTIVGERGTGLSGGQKQRLSLARAILPDPAILILDYTTRAVDMETEEAIQNKLSNMETKATRIIIAQRVSSVKDADCIYIMEDGRIQEQGTHDELVKLRGYYYETCKLQQPGEVF